MVLDLWYSNVWGWRVTAPARISEEEAAAADIGLEFDRGWDRWQTGWFPDRDAAEAVQREGEGRLREAGIR